MATLINRTVLDATHEVWQIVVAGAPTGGITNPHGIGGTTAVDYGDGSIAVQVDGAAGNQLWCKTAPGNAGWVVISAASPSSTATLGEIDIVAEGYIGTGFTAAANKAGFNAACLAAGTQYGVFVQAGTYAMSSGLDHPATTFRIRGAGPYATTFNFADHTLPGLSAGDASGTGYGSKISDINLAGPTAHPTSDGNQALVINGAPFTSIHNVILSNFDIALDFINDCYGAKCELVQAQYGLCNVGVNLRTGAQSGNDITFVDCWFGGAVAGVWTAGNNTNFRFLGGQMSCGTTVSSGAPTPIGVIVGGKDYISGAIAACGWISCYGVDFEGWSVGPAIYGYGPLNIACYECTFLGTVNSASSASSIFTLTNAGDSKLAFRTCSISGYYLNAALGAISGSTGACNVHEEAWASVSPFYIDTVSQGTGTDLLDSICQQSGLGVGTGFNRFGYAVFAIIGGGRIQTGNGAQLMQSSNRGSTTTPIGSPITAKSDLTTQAAAQSGTALLATGSNPQSGTYRIAWSAILTQAASVSSVLGGSTGFTVTYTDVDTNASETTLADALPTATGNTVGLQVSGVVVVNAKTGTAITYSFGYTSSGSPVMQYAIHVRCEQMI